MFNLKFDLVEIAPWSDRYPADEDRRVEMDIAPRVRERGYFTRQVFLEVCI